MSLIDQLKEAFGNGHISPPSDDEMASLCPLLFELLVVDRYADGSKRFLPSISIDRESGGYVVTIKDHATRRQKSVAAPTWSSIPIRLQEALLDETVPWKEFKSFVNPKSNDKKKGN